MCVIGRRRPPNARRWTINIPLPEFLRGLCVWRQRNVVVDDHQRRLAAIAVGCEAHVVFRDFDDEEAALDYAIKSQRDRRSMTDAETISCIIAVDKRKTRGGDRKSEEAKSIPPSGGIDPTSSAEATANLVGISPRKVERARTVIDHAEKTGDDTELKAVKESEGQEKIQELGEEVWRPISTADAGRNRHGLGHTCLLGFSPHLEFRFLPMKRFGVFPNLEHSDSRTARESGLRGDHPPLVRWAVRVILQSVYRSLTRMENGVGRAGTAEPLG